MTKTLGLQDVRQDLLDQIAGVVTQIKELNGVHAVNVVRASENRTSTCRSCRAS